MKKVLFVVALAAMAAQVGGTEYEVTDAWAGSSNVLPCSKTPQWLVSNADHTLTSGEKAKLDEDSGWEAPYCYYYFEPEPREHDYIVLKFEGVSNYNKLISRWRADGAIATETTRAYCWDGENWDP